MREYRQGDGTFLWSKWWEGYCVGPNLEEFKYAVKNYKPRLKFDQWTAFKDGIRDKSKDLNVKQ